MKKVILIVLPLLLIGGAVVGLGMAGVVQIPGLSPKKAKKNATEPVVETTITEPPKPVAKKPKAEPKPKTGDPSKGYDAVATLWNEMDIKTLLPLAERWQDAELAPILARMDNGKVVELLSQMKPERAVAVTRALQKLAEHSG